MKRAILVFGMLGLVGCFLPLIAGESLWGLRSLGWWPVLSTIAAFGIAAAAGASGRGLAQSVVAIAAFVFALYRFDFTGVFDLVLHAQIGGKLMAVGAVGGFLASLGALVERRGASTAA